MDPLLSSILDCSSPLAAIETADTIFYSRYQPKPQEPHSAVTQLIQGIYQAYPENALKILRQPIILNYTPSLLCRGMMAIAGKRHRIELDYFKRPHRQQFTPIIYNSKLTLSKEPLSPPLTNRDIQEWINHPPLKQSFQKQVRAVLVNHDQTYILSAENESLINKTLHSEVVLLQKYYALHQQGFSSPTTLLTNLQSCKMCAAMWWHMHSNPWENLQSIYSHPELGPSARDTVLTSGGNWRRHEAQSEEQLHQMVERPLE